MSKDEVILNISLSLPTYPKSWNTPRMPLCNAHFRGFFFKYTKLIINNLQIIFTFYVKKVIKNLTLYNKILYICISVIQ